MALERGDFEKKKELIEITTTNKNEDILFSIN